jgi:hypothetical protein
MRGLGSVEKGLDAQKGLDAKAVAVLKQSFVEMGLLKEIPDDQILFTTRVLPVNAGM